jgi:hypothetical protein
MPHLRNGADLLTVIRPITSPWAPGKPQQDLRASRRAARAANPRRENVAPLMLVGHPTCKYVGKISTLFPRQAMNNGARRSPSVVLLLFTALTVPEGLGLLKQGRFAHFTDDDIEYFQSKIDEMWNKWLIPRIIPLRKEIESDNSPAI